MNKLLSALAVALFLGASILSAQTAGTVNGIKISVDEANKVLRSITAGKMSWEKLPNQGKKELLEMMAPSRLAVLESKNKLSLKEQEKALSEYWMKKEMSKIKVSDNEVKNTYNRMVKIARETKSTKKIPPFSQAKSAVKRQLQEEKVVKHMMKNAKIKIY